MTARAPIRKMNPTPISRKTIRTANPVRPVSFAMPLFETKVDYGVQGTRAMKIAVGFASHSWKTRGVPIVKNTVFMKMNASFVTRT